MSLTPIRSPMARLYTHDTWDNLVPVSLLDTPQFYFYRIGEGRDSSWMGWFVPRKRSLGRSFVWIGYPRQLIALGLITHQEIAVRDTPTR